jgi:arsenate reductase
MIEPKNVLFLCTGNSARSILGEAILNHMGQGRFRAYSAGSHPAAHPKVEALRRLSAEGVPIEGLRSKSWDEFAGPDAPKMDFVITVCDNAANEPCPYWPGAPLRAHWGQPDPAAVRGTRSELARAYQEAFAVMERRVELLLALPLETLDPSAIRVEIEKIGQLERKQEGEG